MIRVLFLCTHNSARSQMAEGLLRAWAGDRFEVHSAGLEATEVRPLAIHGMAYVDLVLSLDDGTQLTARLGPEAVPDDLSAGERVVAVTVMANVIEVRRVGTERSG